MVREPAGATYETRLDQNGRIVLPAAVRRRLSLKPGDEVVLTVDADGVRVTTLEAAIRAAQDAVRQYVPKGVSLVDELIAWRRAEARRE